MLFCHRCPAKALVQSAPVLLCSCRGHVVAKQATVKAHLLLTRNGFLHLITFVRFLIASTKLIASLEKGLRSFVEVSLSKVTVVPIGFLKS